MARDVAKPPVANASDVFEQVGIEIHHPVAPAVVGCGFAGVQLVRIHGDNRMDGSDVLGAAIAKALGTGFDCADPEGFVGMWFKGVA
ncbi:hypothetical protein D3C71_1223680 [compost metagenome]